MRKLMVVSLTLLSIGCGPSQKQLRGINDLLEKSKQADCETIHYYLGLIQTEIQKKIR